MKRLIVLITLLSLMTTLSIGCLEEEPTTSPTPAKSPESIPTTEPVESDVNFRLLISDEPNEITSFYSLNVTVEQVGFQRKGDSESWTTENITPPETVDLTKLTGANATEIWSGNLTAGEYNKVFIYVNRVEGILNQYSENIPGDNVTVKLPSGKLQVSKPFTITEDDEVSFVFDVTVIKAGKNGKYILKPQIAESGADKTFNIITSQGKGKEKDKSVKIKGDKPEKEKWEGIINSVSSDNTTFTMQVGSDNWTVDLNEAEEIKGMPTDGLMVGLEVEVKGIVVGPYYIKATEVEIKED